MAIQAVAAIGTPDAAPVSLQLGATPPATLPPAGTSFGDVLMAGLRGVDTKVTNADNLVRQFAIDDSVPVHQVTIALEQARLSVEIAMQVRSRLVEGYRELMNMPL